MADARGEPVSPDRYRAMSAFSEGLAVAHRLDGSATLVDPSGRELPTPGRRFAWILPMQDGAAPASTTNGQVGAITRDGAFHPSVADPEAAGRHELTRVSHLLYERGYNVSLDGNVSWRLDDGTLVITPTGAHLGFVRPQDS